MMLLRFILSPNISKLFKFFMLSIAVICLSSCQMSKKKLNKLKTSTVIDNPFEITTIKGENETASETNQEDFHESGPTVVKASVKSSEKKSEVDPKKHSDQSGKNIKANQNMTKTEATQASGATVPTKKIDPKAQAMEKEIAQLEKQYPFQVGERIEFTVRYAAFEAGHFTFEVKPVKKIEGRPVFHFYISARTSSIFAWVYTLKDYAESFWDMKLRRPYLMKIYGEESRFIREVQTTFDWKKKQARYQAKILEIGKGLDEEDKSWDLKHLEAQDVVSALYFLRTKDLAVGKSFDFRVAEKGKDILVRAKVEKEEEISTKLGKFMTYVVKPTFAVDGAWKQKGEMTLWLTKDKHKTPIQFEAKIKLGTIRGRLFSLKN